MKLIELSNNFITGFNVVAYSVKFNNKINFTVNINDSNKGILAICDKTNFRILDISLTCHYGDHTDIPYSSFIPQYLLEFNSNNLIFIYIQIISENNTASNINIELHGDFLFEHLFTINNNNLHDNNKNYFIKKTKNINFDLVNNNGFYDNKQLLLFLLQTYNSLNHNIPDKLQEIFNILIIP